MANLEARVKMEQRYIDCLNHHYSHLCLESLIEEHRNTMLKLKAKELSKELSQPSNTVIFVLGWLRCHAS